MKKSITKNYVSYDISFTIHAFLTYIVMVIALWGVFFYVPTEKMQGIVQRIFYFHVSSALTMFFAFFVVFVASVSCLLKLSMKANEMIFYFGKSNIILHMFLFMSFLVLLSISLSILQGDKIISSPFIRWSAFITLAVLILYILQGLYIKQNLEWWDSVAISAAEIGIVFCTLVLITGPLWARPIWGTWWSWDPTLTLTLVLWLIYVAYLMLRVEVQDARRTRFAAVLGIVGFVDVPIIRWSVEKWRTLHPQPVVIQEGGGTGLSPAMMLTFCLCLSAFMFLFFLLLRERMCLARMRHDIEVLRYAMHESL